VPLAKPGLEPLDTGPADRCNNDHGISPDGSLIVLSSHHEGMGSQVYVMPVAGGALRKVSPQAPSWWHGWSPDGARLAYVAARGGGPIDVYTIAVEGGEETRLTKGEGHCDGPDYSADGANIYYNCDRGGHAQIWVMAADGTGQRQLFSDDQVNWFPHPSPDGRQLVYLAYPPGTLGHPADLPVALVLSDPDGGNRRRVREFIGGQGTINVPSWAPDSSAFAYVRYEP
jgi:Tol biopolymer transport system component